MHTYIYVRSLFYSRIHKCIPPKFRAFHFFAVFWQPSCCQVATYSFVHQLHPLIPLHPSSHCHCPHPSSTSLHMATHIPTACVGHPVTVMLVGTPGIRCAINRRVMCRLLLSFRALCYLL